MGKVEADQAVENQRITIYKVSHWLLRKLSYVERGIHS